MFLRFHAKTRLQVQFIDLVLFQVFLKSNARSRGFFLINIKQKGPKNQSKLPFYGVLKQVFGYFQYFFGF